MAFTFHTISQAQNYLFNNIPKTSAGAFKGQTGLDRAKYFFNQLNNPQDDFKSIHIAGTSGKGSVSYILTALTSAHGYRVGTHTSPHLYDIRERCMINGRLADVKDFLTVLNELVPEIENMSQSTLGPPSFFEITNALAFRLFTKKSVDYAVIETGLGGLYDSTNTVSRSDKLALITKLGYDHTDILGDTIQEIAYQKAGIINVDSNVIALLPHDDVAKRAIEKTSKQRRAKLTFTNPAERYTNCTQTNSGMEFDYKSSLLQLDKLALNLIGEHQIENTIIALQALEYLSERDHFTLNPDAIRGALTQISIPGRFEIRQHNNHKIILDGAHNTQKMSALTNAFAKYTGNIKAVACIALKSDKELDTIIELLTPHIHTAVVSQYTINPDDKLHAPMNPDIIAQKLLENGIEAIVEATSPKHAISKAFEVAKSGEPILVTGSIYFVGEVGTHLKPI